MLAQDLYKQQHDTPKATQILNDKAVTWTQASLAVETG